MVQLPECYRMFHHWSQALELPAKWHYHLQIVGCELVKIQAVMGMAALDVIRKPHQHKIYSFSNRLFKIALLHLYQIEKIHVIQKTYWVYCIVQHRGRYFHIVQKLSWTCRINQVHNMVFCFCRHVRQRFRWTKAHKNRTYCLLELSSSIPLRPCPLFLINSLAQLLPALFHVYDKHVSEQRCTGHHIVAFRLHQVLNFVQVLRELKMRTKMVEEGS